MANSVNKAIILGRLGADPELRYTAAGKAVCNFNVATSSKWTDKSSGEKHEKTSWHKITAWGTTGEACKEFLIKGQRVYVEGYLDTNVWEDRDGNKRYTTYVVAGSVVFLDRPKGKQGAPPTFPSEDAPPGGREGNDEEIPF